MSVHLPKANKIQRTSGQKIDWMQLDFDAQFQNQSDPIDQSEINLRWEKQEGTTRLGTIYTTYINGDLGGGLCFVLLTLLQ